MTYEALSPRAGESLLEHNTSATSVMLTDFSQEQAQDSSVCSKPAFVTSESICLAEGTRGKEVSGRSYCEDATRCDADGLDVPSELGHASAFHEEMSCFDLKQLNQPEPFRQPYLRDAEREKFELQGNSAPMLLCSSGQRDA